MNLNSSKSNIISKFNYRDFIIFIVPILIFGLYLFVYNPGILTAASYGQLHQIAAGEFTAASPIFHTFLVMLCLKITNGVTFMGVFQILIFSIMWTVICKYHRDDLSQGSDEFVLQFILTLIICLIPINAVYSITLSSNILFSYSIMFLCFLIKVMIDKDGEIDLKLGILLALTLAIMSGLNNYGIQIALILLIVIIYYLFRKNTSKNTLKTMIGVALVCILLIGSLNMIYEVKGNNYNETTRNLDTPVNDAFDDGIDLEGARNEFFSSSNLKPVESYENMVSSNAGHGNYNLVDSFVSLFRDSFILGGLFVNPTFYLILSVILLVLINITIKSEEIYLLYLPPFLNVLISLFTGQNNMYYVLLVFYLIMVIFIDIRFKTGLNVSDFTNIKPSIPSLGKIATQPKLESKQDYVEDDYYSTLESEIDSLTLDDINEMLGETRSENAKTEQTTPQRQSSLPDESSDGDGDLIDEILKEIEMGNK